MSNPYEFRNLATGQMCCSVQKPSHLCARCLAQYQAQTALAPTVAASGVPSAPDLVNSTREQRGLPPLAPTPVPPRLAPAAAGIVPDAPRLDDAIRAARKAGAR